MASNPSTTDAPAPSHTQSSPPSEPAPSGTNSNPAWSELRTKAGKERKRLPLACIACRRKKIRCSGDKPACVHCSRSRIPCVYKVTTRKAAPRTDYMAMLDKRLKKMEERVIKVIPREEMGIVGRTGRAVVRPAVGMGQGKEGGAGGAGAGGGGGGVGGGLLSRKRTRDDLVSENLDAWAADGKGEGARGAAATTQGHMRVQSHDENSLMTDGEDRLPSRQMQEHLAQVYFDFVYGQGYHLLHRPSYMRQLAEGTVPPVVVLAVCAISARFSDHPQLRSEPAFLRGEEWASAARDIALRRYDSPSVPIVTVYLLLGLHEFGTCHGGRSWMLGGMAQRMAYALQLHRDLEYDPQAAAVEGARAPKLTDTEREIRRRTLWACTIMDRFTSSGTERPFFMEAKHIPARLPIREDLFQMEVTGPTEDLEGRVALSAAASNGELNNAPASMGVAAYMVRLIHLWGRVIEYVNLGGKERDSHRMWLDKSDFMAIKRSVDGWKRSLPNTLTYNADNLHTHASQKIANQFLLLHIIYHQILVFMNRFVFPAPGSRPSFPRDMPMRFVAEASRTATESARAIAELIAISRQYRVVAPFAGYSAFVSSTILVHGVFSSDLEAQAASKLGLSRNLQYLTAMKRYWGTFHSMTESLRSVYQKYAEAAKSGQQFSEEEGSQTIFQYGDWFDRYPHGVSGTDYEEPSNRGSSASSSAKSPTVRSGLQTVEEFFTKSTAERAAAEAKALAGRKAVKKRRASTKADGKPLSRTTSIDTTEAQADDVHSTSAQAQAQADRPKTSSPIVPIQDAYALGVPGLGSMAYVGAPAQQHLPMHVMPPASQRYSAQIQQPQHRPVNVASFADDSQVEPPNMQPNMSAIMSAMVDQTAISSLPMFDYNTFQNLNTVPDGIWQDSSTAWLMPFNMEPPNSDSNASSALIGTNELDWASSFQGFDAGANMPVQSQQQQQQQQQQLHAAQHLSMYGRTDGAGHVGGQAPMAPNNGMMGHLQ